MRRLPALLALLASLAALSACGESTDSSSSAAAPAAATTGARAADPAAFPVTIRHRYGTTTITEAPERVVVVGLREQDALLSLGVVPVGTTEWYGKHPGAIFPWATKALGSAPRPEVLSFADGIQFEKVAALRPDLILGIYSGLTKDDYAKLAKIAPTVAQPPGQVDWGSSWQDELTISGRAVGRPKLAAQVKAKAEAQLAAVRRAHPEFRGQTALVTSTYKGVYVYGPQDARSRFMTDLGFSFPTALRSIGGKDFGGQLSEEKTDLLDVGALLWFASPANAAKMKQDGLYRRLKVRTEGRDIFLPEQGTLYEATSFISPLSIPLLVDQLVPKLAAAADGDPETTA
jgi:iron complex transport system substrate-binding protein